MLSQSHNRVAREICHCALKLGHENNLISNDNQGLGQRDEMKIKLRRKISFHKK